MAKYKMTQEEYNILVREYHRLSEKLENAEIIKPAKKTSEDCLPKVRGMSGRLDTGKLRLLFGTNYRNILFYNFETSTWNKKEYLGYPIWNVRYNTLNVKKIKKHIEESKDYRHLEVLGVAVMPISLKKYKDFAFGTVISNPKFSSKGLGVVGAIVCRDRRIGQIMGLDANWVMVESYPTTQDLVQAAASRFAVECVKDYYFLQDFMEYYK